MMIDTNGFDRDFYLSRNRDVAEAGIDPYRHYLDYGWREGRDPNALFDTSYYLASNPDVAAAKIDPLAHYIESGWRESRDPSADFDTSDYLAANPDVLAADTNPLVHYLRFGRAEGRLLEPDPRVELDAGFDREFYLRANPDVARSNFDPFVHYTLTGRAEGRKPNAFFDPAFYLASNPDVAAAKVDPLNHFLRFGFREGRDPSAAFDLDEYRAVVGTPSRLNPLTEYLRFDRYAGLPSEVFDADPPQVIQSRGNPLSAILVGSARFAVNGSLTRVTATDSLLDGHDLSGFGTFALGRSIADIAITGRGRLPLFITLGSGDDRLEGTFDLGGQILNFFANEGTLTVAARFDNGFAALNGGSAGSNVTVTGTATVSYTGGAGADNVIAGSGNDSLFGGLGTNRLDGGAGVDSASWSVAVRADLGVGHAIPLGSAAFGDTLVSIENLGGSAFDDILIGNDGANILYGAFTSPGSSGDDILAGAGGNDTLFGLDGDDILLGGRGTDSLYGDGGADLIVDAADGWANGAGNPIALGGAGRDTLVYLLGETGDVSRGNFMDGGTGADVYVVDTSLGRWGSLGLQFSLQDGDRLDLSALRTRAGDILTLDDVLDAASTPFYGSTTIDLSQFEDAAGNALAGRIVLNSVFSPDDLLARDFIFANGVDWRAEIPADLLTLI